MGIGEGNGPDGERRQGMKELLAGEYIYPGMAGRPDNRLRDGAVAYEGGLRALM